MKVKKFIAPSMPEAMKKVRNELGKDAVILNSKVVQKGGILGYFMKKNIEVIAAVDPDTTRARKENKPQPDLPNRPLQVNDRENARVKVPASQPSLHEQKLLAEINELKQMMEQYGSPKEAGVTKDIAAYPIPIQNVANTLKEIEITDKYINEILPFILEKWFTHEKPTDTEIIFDWVKLYFASKLHDFHFGGLDYRKKYMNVIGPTGVGKTTTLAKIAAQAVLKDGKKTAFITTDTYRIAAIDQLKTYASILGIPIEVAYSMEDLQKAKAKFAHMDVILIDTAGRNFRDKHYVDELSKLIDFNKEMDTYLVLSLTSKLKDMQAIYKQFSYLEIDRFIFTKADETSAAGAALNMMLESGIGIAYFTNGQNVPDDIEEMTLEHTLDKILEETYV